MKKILFCLSLIFLATGISGDAQAAESSQCATGTAPGSQTGCTHANDTTILLSQCVPTYGEDSCGTMGEYLSAMQEDCNSTGTSGVDCATITSGGYYGREASAFATYLENNPSAANSSSPASTMAAADSAASTSSLGDLEYPTGFGLPDPAGGLEGVLTGILNWLLMIVGIIAMISFIISGLQYFLASGEEKQAETAKKNMVYSILGVIAALSGFIIVRAVDAALNATTSLF